MNIVFYNSTVGYLQHVARGHTRPTTSILGLLPRLFGN